MKAIPKLVICGTHSVSGWWCGYALAHEKELWDSPRNAPHRTIYFVEGHDKGVCNWICRECAAMKGWLW